MELVLDCITKKYENFSDRARRKDYWLFQLTLFIAFVVALIVDTSLGFQGGYTNTGPATIVLYIAIIPPAMAVAVRRLHDIDRTGWWLLFSAIPLVGIIVLLVFHCLRGTKGPNRFGPDPITQ
ncbi:DUF805 domain-containing protein [Alphaproteobacteria bacterium]|nr:DUF805 domain-containing protein [Alphaproteobacteria bacterium]